MPLVTVAWMLPCRVCSMGGEAWTCRTVQFASQPGRIKRNAGLPQHCRRLQQVICGDNTPGGGAPCVQPAGEQAELTLMAVCPAWHHSAHHSNFASLGTPPSNSLYNLAHHHNSRCVHISHVHLHANSALFVWCLLPPRLLGTPTRRAQLRLRRRWRLWTRRWACRRCVPLRICSCLPGADMGEV